MTCCHKQKLKKGIQNFGIDQDHDIPFLQAFIKNQNLSSRRNKTKQSKTYSALKKIFANVFGTAKIRFANTKIRPCPIKKCNKGGT